MVTIRDATLDEHDYLARLLHDAFLNNWDHHYFANATRTPAPLLPSPTKPTTRLHFYRSIIRGVKLLGGRVRVAVVSSDSSAPEQIVGIALWLPPSKRLSSPLLLYRAGFGRVFLGWGFPGVHRIVMAYEDPIDALAKASCPFDPVHDAWFLQMLAVAPGHGGKGIGGTLVRDGLAEIVQEAKGRRTAYLYTSTDRGRKLYEREGFEVKGEQRILQGVVDGKGFRLKKGWVRKTKDETGGTVWVMAKRTQ